MLLLIIISRYYSRVSSKSSMNTETIKTSSLGTTHSTGAALRPARWRYWVRAAASCGQAWGWQGGAGRGHCGGVLATRGWSAAGSWSPSSGSAWCTTASTWSPWRSPSSSPRPASGQQGVSELGGAGTPLPLAPLAAGGDAEQPLPFCSCSLAGVPLLVVVVANESGPIECGPWLVDDRCSARREASDRDSRRHHSRFTADHTCGWQPTTTKMSTPCRRLTTSVAYHSECGPPTAQDTTSATHVTPITTTSLRHTRRSVALQQRHRQHVSPIDKDQNFEL